MNLNLRMPLKFYQQLIFHQVEEVRRQTRQEKKRLAMETRKKELSRLGLRANDKEQITSQSTLLSKMGEIAEESGLVSVEKYKFKSYEILHCVMT